VRFPPLVAVCLKTRRSRGSGSPDDGVLGGAQSFKTRLLVDAMGHFSAMMQQSAAGQKPDGVCAVVEVVPKFPKMILAIY